MNRDEIIHAWRRRRAAGPNVDLASRVMQAIDESERMQAQGGVLLALLTRLAATRGGRFGLFLAALSLGLSRFVYLAIVVELIEL